MVTFLLVIVGGLNWLLQGAFGWDIGQIFGGQDAAISRIIYILVGLSAIYELTTHKKNCRMCGPDMASSAPMSGHSPMEGPKMGQ